MAKFLSTYRKKIEEALDRYLPTNDCYPKKLHQAMRYSVFAGGKRIRGILALVSAEMFKVSENASLRLAAGLECAHTYSLIHDDLPAMDDDDIRRGKPANHKVYGEALAILSGDALLTLAFQLVAEIPGDCGATTQVLREFSRVLGSQGMVGGQAVDMESENQDIDIPTLQYIHTHKTGALINFSVISGALLSGNASAEQLKALNDYGERLGLAFQIMDDILDLTSNTEKLGKESGQDDKLKKATYISRYGLAESRKQVQELIAEAIEVLDVFSGAGDKLVSIADYFGQRES